MSTSIRADIEKGRVVGIIIDGEFSFADLERISDAVTGPRTDVVVSADEYAKSKSDEEPPEELSRLEQNIREIIGDHTCSTEVLAEKVQMLTRSAKIGEMAIAAFGSSPVVEEAQDHFATITSRLVLLDNVYRALTKLGCTRLVVPLTEEYVDRAIASVKSRIERLREALVAACPNANSTMSDYKLIDKATS